jgi:hypothetical protein
MSSCPCWQSLTTSASLFCRRLKHIYLGGVAAFSFCAFLQVVEAHQARTVALALQDEEDEDDEEDADQVASFYKASEVRRIETRQREHQEADQPVRLVLLEAKEAIEKMLGVIFVYINICTFL